MQRTIGVNVLEKHLVNMMMREELEENGLFEYDMSMMQTNVAAESYCVGSGHCGVIAGHGHHIESVEGGITYSDVALGWWWWWWWRW